MRLIDAPIGIFRFDGELVLKTEYYSKDKQSGKYIPDCYIIRTGEYFWGSAKTANELINLDIEPVDFAELLPTVTDTISRQAAIDALDKEYRCTDRSDDWDGLKTAMLIIENLPSTQPERTCVNCGRTANNGGWYADGGTRCPIEEHYALPKDGYCHLWEKRNVTDDDYPERRTDE